ncbi:hypothetical protein J4E91_008716 [Alternaria rosae]|nr:hypothetical protein J4E91_008716 [Alternaria rosae]
MLVCDDNGGNVVAYVVEGGEPGQQHAIHLVWIVKGVDDDKFGTGVDSARADFSLTNEEEGVKGPRRLDEALRVDTS